LFDVLSWKKAVNHGRHSEHGEKARDCVLVPDHQLGDSEVMPEAEVFRRARRVRCGSTRFLASLFNPLSRSGFDT
jgi:hypothetical protein